MEQLTSLYQSLYGEEPLRMEAINAAGSNRQYVRIYGNKNTVIGVKGTSIEENAAFIHLAQHFEAMRLPMPRILCADETGTYYLQEDLGNQTLYDALRSGRQAGGDYSTEEIEWLRQTIRFLPAVQIDGAKGLDWSVCYPSPQLDAMSIRFDLNYFKYNFLKFTGVDFNEVKLESDLSHLTEDLENAGPTGFMYRDFQARNVMLVEGKPHFIDFQGGRRGPVLYDVASFLWQASAQYPASLRHELFEIYLEELSTKLDFDRDKMYDALDLLVLFRLLQVLGAYGFRGLFERKPYFISSIGPALDSLQELLSHASFPYPYLTELLGKICSLNGVQLPDRWIAFSRGKAQPIGKSSASSFDNQGLLTVRVFSFSYKKGIPTDISGNGGGYVFDCRATHNPGRFDVYKPLTGLDQPVIEFLESNGEILTFLESVYALADHHVERYMSRGFTDLMFCFGCTGGRHRSVYSAQHLAEHIHAKYGVKVILEHREQQIKTILA